MFLASWRYRLLCTLVMAILLTPCNAVLERCDAPALLQYGHSPEFLSIFHIVLSDRRWRRRRSLHMCDGGWRGEHWLSCMRRLAGEKGPVEPCYSWGRFWLLTDSCRVCHPAMLSAVQTVLSHCMVPSITTTSLLLGWCCSRSSPSRAGWIKCISSRWFTLSFCLFDLSLTMLCFAGSILLSYRLVVF